MAVEAELGVVGEVGAELEKKGAEVAVHAVHIKVIDHRRGTHQPGIGGAGLLIAPPLGAEHGRLFLRLTNEENPFLTLELAPVSGYHIVLALFLLECHQGEVLLLGELLHGCDEILGDGIHQSAGSELVTAVKAEEACDSSRALQGRDVHVQVHPVNSLDLQGDVLLKHFRNGPW